MDERRLRRELRDAPLPDEAGARDRGWRVVRAAFVERERIHPATRRPAKLLLAAAGVAAVLAIVLSPAGAKVAAVFRDVTGIGKENARPALSSLPTAGRVLVSSGDGVWVVSEDGSKRLLGDYRDATWSPHGLFVAATSHHQLAAIEPGAGTVRWTLARPTVGDPAWAPSGFRIAYRSDGDLRLVAGDGSPDRLLAKGAAGVTPAWRPLSKLGRLMVTKLETPPEEVAFVDRTGRIHVVDLRSTGRATQAWTARTAARPHELLWSSDRRRLIAVETRRVQVYGADGRLERTLNLAADARAGAAALGPAGDTLAVATASTARSGASRGEIELLHLDGGSGPRRVFSGPGRFSGLAFSPNGRWLLVGWRDADQWLFIPRGGGRVKAVGHISRQFAPGASGPAAFPRLDGWCCGR
jgi:WD40 repeat protein